jgi:hypothetical protein
MDTSPIVRAGIDWFSCTVKPDAPDLSRWKRACIARLELMKHEGYELRPSVLQGYKGIQAGACFFGDRPDGYLMQLSGVHADAGFDSVYMRDAHIARIDVQCTVQLEVMDTTIAQVAYGSATRANLNVPRPRRRKLFLITGSDGGDTFYLGSTSSEQRGRLYNKEVQSEDPQYTRCWRYEVVFRNELASGIAAGLANLREKRPRHVEAIVSLWYHSRGVDTSLLDTTTTAPLPLLRTIPTDVERQLRWIENQVAPTIRRLCGRGYRDTIQTWFFDGAPQDETDEVPIHEKE